MFVKGEKEKDTLGEISSGKDVIPNLIPSPLTVTPLAGLFTDIVSTSLVMYLGMKLDVTHQECCLYWREIQSIKE